MYRRAAIGALLVPAILRAVPQTPETAPQPVVLKSTARVVQLDVFVSDPSGNPVHGLRKGDFVVTDNGRPRDIPIFSAETDGNRTPPSSAAAPAMYSNRLNIGDSPIVTAIVIDAVPRPREGETGPLALRLSGPRFSLFSARSNAIGAIYRMQPGQTIAIYAVCPDLRLLQDYSSDPGRLITSLRAFVFPAAGNKEQKAETLAPPMLSALREVAGRMSGASGRKSIIWISQAYGADLKLSAISAATDSAIEAFNNANVTLYAVDARLPACPPPAPSFPNGGPAGGGIEHVTCSQPPDISNKWMEYFAHATGGRAFSGVTIQGVQSRDPQTGSGWGSYQWDNDHSFVEDAIRFAADDSRSAYEMGFYVSDSELDGQVHTLRVTLPAHPQFGLRYRSGYTASAEAAAPPAARQETEELGIHAKIDAVTKNQLRVSLALAPETVTQAADGAIVLDATFAQIDSSGKQLAKVQETVQVPSPETQTDIVRYSRALKLSKGAALLRIGIRDPATGRAGSIAIPIGPQ